MSYITIQHISICVHDMSYGGYHYRVDVVVTMSSEAWLKMKKKKQLGMLYGVDIGNAIYRLNHNIPAYHPMVGDRERSRNGIKTIKLSYHFNDEDKAAALGLDIKSYTGYRTVYSREEAAA